MKRYHVCIRYITKTKEPHLKDYEKALDNWKENNNFARLMKRDA